MKISCNPRSSIENIQLVLTNKIKAGSLKLEILLVRLTAQFGPSAMNSLKQPTTLQMKIMTLKIKIRIKKNIFIMI
jgi:hypothetical protein